MTGALLPVLTMAGALLLDLLPLPEAPAPWLLLAMFYRWAVAGPGRLSPLVTFAFGCAADALAGIPLGVTAAALLVAQALIRPWQRWLRRQPWPVAWLVFPIVAALVAGLRWIILSLLMGRMLPAAPVVAEAALSVAVYPLAAGLVTLLTGKDPATAHAAARG